MEMQVQVRSILKAPSLLGETGVDMVFTTITALLSYLVSLSKVIADSEAFTLTTYDFAFFLYLFRSNFLDMRTQI